MSTFSPHTAALQPSTMAMYYASADELGPTLRGQLLKKHKGSFGATLGERYFEVDDALGCVLLCFKSGEDLHKRLPHHVSILEALHARLPFMCARAYKHQNSHASMAARSRPSTLCAHQRMAALPRTIPACYG